MSSKQLHYLKDLIVFCEEHRIKTGISLEEAKIKVDDDVLLSRHIAHCWNYIHMNRLDGEFRKQNPSETYFVGLRNKPYSAKPVPFSRKRRYVVMVNLVVNILSFLVTWTIVMIASLMIGYMAGCVFWRNIERAQLDTELIFFYSWVATTLALTVLLIIFGR